jgi:hypothetical protein
MAANSFQQTEWLERELRLRIVVKVKGDEGKMTHERSGLTEAFIPVKGRAVERRRMH